MTKGSALSAPAGALTFDSDAVAVNNRVNVTAIPGGDYRVTDTIAPVVASAGCVPERVDAAVCADPLSGQLSGGPGNDTITTSGALPVTLQGEDGNDTMRSGAGGDSLVGALGNDNLTGGAGVDDLDGNEGADTLDGGIGADHLDGGTGTDTATWATRDEPVVVDIDAEADDGNDDDGLPGARDTTSATIENLTGGLGADTLTGSAAANVFDGGFGGDVIDGLGGLNTITYAKRFGPVTVDLDAGTGGDPFFDDPLDTLTNIRNIVGGSGADSLTGDELANKITGGKGADGVTAGEGADQVIIRDAGVVDTADCGGGTDRFRADPGDNLTSCETAFYRPSAGLFDAPPRRGRSG
jgi:Ca2+-binding RTX toxin-like protein